MAAGPHFDASALVLNPMLLVATTRKPVNGARGKPWFGTERALNMTIARATLTPPDDGRFSLASLGPVDWNLDKIEPVAQIGDLVDPTAGGHDVLIYVHGYNTTFETAALDAARLSDGIQFVGETMVFSWPSRASLLDYGYDRESAMWSRDALQQVLNGLIASPVVGHVHVVAHSIGTMLTMEALRQLYAQLGAEAPNRIGAVVFASPDIDMDGFSSSVQRIGPLAPKIIVVTAANDRALAVSRWMAGGNHQGRRSRDGAARAHGDPCDRCFAAGLGHHQSRPVPVQRAASQSDPRRPRRASWAWSVTLCRALAGAPLNVWAATPTGPVRLLRACPASSPGSGILAFVAPLSILLTTAGNIRPMTTLAPEIAMISIDPNKTIESISARQTLAGRSEHHRGGSLFWTPNRGPDPSRPQPCPTGVGARRSKQRATRRPWCVVDLFLNSIKRGGRPP
jgi:pimeloyl-ACP methyl ester carboxylesterase